MANDLNGKRIAILIAPKCTEQRQSEGPRQAVEQAGGRVDVIRIERREAHAYNNDLPAGDKCQLDKAFDQAAHDAYHAVIVPGGAVGADTLRGHDAAARFVRSFFA